MTAWEKMEFSDKTITDLKLIQLCSPTEKEREYYENVESFITDVKDREFADLEVKQQNWLQNIRSDLKSRGY